MSVFDILNRLKGVRRSGSGWVALCPAHDDRHQSLSVAEGEGGRPLLKCHAGCTYEAIKLALGINGGGKGDKQVVATYDYRDEQGSLLYQAVRFEPKGFSQRRPDGAGEWLYKLNGVRRVPYGLPELLAADPSQPVFIVEGEKDADRLADLGLVATTNAGGAGKWRDEFSQYLRGYHTVIIPDNDEPGRDHAAKVARSLQGVAASVRVLELPNLPPKGDVSDWLDAGATADELRALAESAPEIRRAERAGAKAAGGSQATCLVALAAEAELFHAPDGRRYATVSVNGHRETLPLKSAAFRDWLSHGFYALTRSSPGASALQDALNTLSGMARFEGQELETFVRLAEHDGAIYLDLCDRQWRTVRVTAEGWTVIPEVPVKFRRTRGMLPLPEPERGGSIHDLRPFVNLRGDEDWTLLGAWLVAALRPRGPYPALILNGEQGSAKSTTGRVLRGLVDPNTAALRSEPRDERDLMIAATNGWCLAFDNLSRIPNWLSDGLCRIATGGGFATRELYANEEEILFDAQRPVLLTSIEELATRSDLLDRALILPLPSIPEERRKVESTFWREFNEARPRILGALLDAVSVALRNEPHVRLGRLPRMADFAVWATAAEPGLKLPSGAFMAAYDSNRAAANDLALEASPVAVEVLKLMGGREELTATYTDLLTDLEKVFGDSPKRPEGWPKSARGLAGELTRVAVNLRKAGVDVKPAGREGGSGRKQVTLSRLEHPSDQSSQHSPRSQPGENVASAGEHSDAAPPRHSQGSQQHSRVNVGDDGFCEDCERGECQMHIFSEEAAGAAFAEVDGFFRKQAAEEVERAVWEGYK